jgi:mRNA-degrading endonuclease RelE of RelBE toxin-antitoxin system
MLELEFSNQAAKFIKKNKAKSPALIKSIYKEISDLLNNPTLNTKKLVGQPYFRIRIGDCRIIYKFDCTSLYIVAIGKRDKIYSEI